VATEDLIIRVAARGADQAAGKLDKVGKAGAAVGAAIAASAATAGYGVKKAMDFEVVLSEVKAITGATTAELETMADAALDLGAKSGLGATAAAQAMAELAKAGMDAQTTIGALPATITLAQAGQMDLAEAAAATANTMGLFALEASEAGHIADALATAANATTADVKDFTMALTQGGSAARAAGMDFDDTVVALEALAAIGVKNSDAGTSLKAMLTQLAKPTGDAAAMARKLGLDFFDAEGNFKSLASVSGMLGEAFDGLTNEQRLAAATTLVGTDGQRALLALYNAGPERLEAYRKGLGEQGTAADVAKDKNDNLAGALSRLHASIDAVLIRNIRPYLVDAADAVNGLVTAIQTGEGPMGTAASLIGRLARYGKRLATTFAESVQPIVSDVASLVGRLADQFKRGEGAGGLLRDGIKLAGDAALIAAGSIDDVYNAIKAAVDFIRDNQDPFIVLGAVIAGFMAPFGAYALLMGAWTLATSAAAVAAGVAAAATTAWGVAIAIVTSPIALVIAAVAGIVAALVLLWKKNEGFRNWVKGAWSDISSWVSGAAEDIGGFFSGIPGALKGAFQSLVNFIIGRINAVIGLFNKAIELFNAIPGHADVPTIGLIAEVGGDEPDPGFQSTGNARSFEDRAPRLAKGGTVRGVGSWITGEAGAERNTRHPDGTVTVEPLTQSTPGRTGASPSVRIVARDGATKMLLEQLIERIDFDAPRAA
jgi:TP901 family phage tail tape measure protein